MATTPMPNKLHIVMLPFMAQGHLIPFLSLAKLIEQRYPDFTITIVNTPLNIQTLQSSLPPHSNIHLLSLPFSTSIHGLPPNIENTHSLPAHRLLSLMHASESLEPHFNLLISDLSKTGPPRLCIIADVVLGWTVATARRHNAFHATFTTCGAYGTAVYYSIWLHLPHTHSPESMEFGLPWFPPSFRIHRSQLSHYLRAADGSDAWSLFLQKHIRLSFSSDALLCHTAEEVEPLGLSILRCNTGLKVYPIGPLNLLSVRRAGEKTEMGCVAWLDTHPAGSVIYVSFGSQNSISASQMKSLAAGLEASEKPFIWVIRPPIGFDVNGEMKEEWLPEGFSRRVSGSGRGLLVERWAPQLEILGHKSTGVFISHCGWNSVVESLSQGVPIIGWPLMSEQFYNTKMMEEELGVCVELGRGVEDEVESPEVERVIRMVLDGEKGKEMKQKALKCMEMMREAMKDDGDVKGSSLTALDEFIKSVSVSGCA